MSDDSNEYVKTSIFRRPMPVWLAATIVGCFLGGFGMYQVMCAVGYELPDQTVSGDTDVRVAEMQAGMEEGMRQSMMGMMSMMRMMRGITSEQESLTTLVGKLDLLSHGLRIELKPEQTEKLASALAKLDLAEQMTSDEAHAHLDAIQKLLTEEQNTALATVELPRSGMMGSDMMDGGMMGSGGAPSDDNPFQQEINQKRLHDFLDHLRDSSVEPPYVTEATTGSG